MSQYNENSISQMTNTAKLIEDAKYMTALTGELYDLQLLNLQMWPLVLLDHVDEVKIDYDLSKQSSTQVHGKHVNMQQDIEVNNSSKLNYYLTLKQGKQLSDMKNDPNERMQMLHCWVKDMLWTDINLKVFINNNLEFDSKEQQNHDKRE